MDFYRDYSFLAQILPYEDPELEKLYILLKKLIAKLMPPKSEDLAIGILDNVDFDSYRVQLNKTLDISLEGNGALSPSQADGTSKIPEPELEELIEIVKEFNERYGGDIQWSEDDKLIKGITYVNNEIQGNKKLIKAAYNSDKQNTRIEFEKELENTMKSILNTHFVLFQRFNDNSEFKERITQKMFDIWYDKINKQESRAI